MPLTVGSRIAHYDVTALSSPPASSFDAEDYYFEAIGRNYDIAPDGRFLMIKNDAPTVPQINVVLDWFQELTERVPTGQ